ncbi:MAG TPA: L,D-transpeptidase family protein, partial [Beijerinckiaceae bacterium]|nr:L,D-transpeptidase family protein [Beijerinckiaceae bacterium]
MRLKASLLTATSLLALAFLSLAPASRAQTGSPEKAPIVLPALPDAPVVFGKPDEAPAVAKKATAAAEPAPAAPAPASAAPEKNAPPAAPKLSDAASAIPQPLSGAPPRPAANAKVAAPKSPSEASGVPLTPATAPAEASVPPPPPPLQAALDEFVHADLARGRTAIALRKTREAIASFYAGRQYAPLWFENASWTPAARAVAARLKSAAEDGLDPARLHIPALASGDAAPSLAAELALSAAVVAYGEDASAGAVDPRAISRMIAEPRRRFSPAEILARVVSAPDPAKALEDLNPPQAGYRALRTKLAQLREARSVALAARVASVRTPPTGLRDGRASIIRARFGLVAPGAASGEEDAGAVAAITGFQRLVGLAPSGRLTPRTLELLSGRRAATLENDIIVNMEFWRWQPRHMGTNRIEVNIPDYSLTLYRGDEVVHSARVIVGKPATPTPVFSDEIRYVVVNPSWHVPQSIIKKEMLPKALADPYYFQKMGLVVTQKGDQLAVRQPPGPHNALGQIKFVFPNDYAVYLHDTPDRYLFRDARRAFSHGCVRMQDPFALAGLVLGRERGMSEARLKSMIGDQTHTLRLPQPLPI